MRATVARILVLLAAVAVAIGATAFLRLDRDVVGPVDVGSVLDSGDGEVRREGRIDGALVPATGTEDSPPSRRIEAVASTPPSGSGGPGGRVVGIVRDPSGAPLAGVPIQLHPPEPAAFEAMPDELRRRLAGRASDDDGRFHFAGVPAGGWRVRAGGVRHRTTWSRFDVADGATTFVELILEIGGAASGVVVDDAGRPLSGVRIEPSATPVVTAADGSFRVTGLPSGNIEISARKPGYALEPPAPPRATVIAGAETTGVRITMVPAAPIHGSVTDVEGRPLAGATVHAHSRRGNTLYALATTSADAAGRYELAEIPSTGVYRIVAAANDYREKAADEVRPGARVDFELERTGWIEVRPIDAATGGAVEPTALLLASVPPWSSTSDGFVRDRFEPDVVRATSGVFRVPYPESGIYRVQVDAPGYAACRTEALTIEGVETIGPVVLLLERGGEIHGRVVRASDGGVIAGAEVILLARLSDRRAAGHRQFGIEIRDDHDVRAMTSSDQDGEFRFDGLGSGVLALRVSAVGFATGQWDGVDVRVGAATTVETPLSSGGVLSGRVIGLDGQPAPGRPIVAHQAFGLCRGGDSDPAGAYRLEHVPPGRYRVEAGDPRRGSGGRFAMHLASGGVAPPDPRDYPIVVRDGLETRVDLDLAASERCGLTGVLLVREVPAPGFKVKLDRADGGGDAPIVATFGASDVTDDRGAFELHDVPAGVWFVVVEAKGESRPMHRRRVELVPGAISAVEIRLDPARVHGTVVDERGRPVDDATVVVVREWKGDDLWGNRSEGTGPLGRFDFDLLPLGRYLIHAESPATVSSRSTIELADGTDREMRLVARDAGTLRVALEPKGWNVESLTVSLEGPSGRFVVGQKVVDRDGSLLLRGLPAGWFELCIRDARLSRRACKPVEVFARNDEHVTLRFESSPR